MYQTKNMKRAAVFVATIHVKRSFALLQIGARCQRLRRFFSKSPSSEKRPASRHKAGPGGRLERCDAAADDRILLRTKKGQWKDKHHDDERIAPIIRSVCASQKIKLQRLHQRFDRFPSRPGDGSPAA
jgi:hypothetical protein